MDLSEQSGTGISDCDWHTCEMSDLPIAIFQFLQMRTTWARSFAEALYSGTREVSPLHNPTAKYIEGRDLLGVPRWLMPFVPPGNSLWPGTNHSRCAP
jgi:hypothetical protein